ncbi:MAG TPA: hypothetical protein VHC39_11545 [Rhizomicrobium sp.]|nr:hypothetical protein [Rhizomicrobium sp.]
MNNREFTSHNREISVSSEEAKALQARKIEETRIRLAAYEGTDAAKAGLARIAGSPEAIQALVDLSLTEAELTKIIKSFATATKIKAEFRLLLAQETAFLELAERLKSAVTNLRDFVKEISDAPPDDIRATLVVGAADRSWFLGALYEIGVLIEQRERIARETLPRIGATRKMAGETAEENAAIGWVAASIQRVTGRPWLRQSGILAGTLLGIDEVSEDRLRGTLRNFTDRDWRQP